MYIAGGKRPKVAIAFLSFEAVFETLMARQAEVDC